MDYFAEIADERRITADLILTLDAEQLATTSLCDAWTVKQVAGHLVMPLVTPMPAFMVAMAKARGNFDRANDSLSRKVAKKSPAELAGILRDKANFRFTPPGMGPLAPLTDVLVHGQDMRRPLGLTRDFEPARIIAVLDYLTDPDARSIVPRTLVADLHFRATDLEWSAGTGPEVAGPAGALMLALANRPTAFDELSGDGVDTLLTRLGE